MRFVYLFIGCLTLQVLGVCSANAQFWETGSFSPAKNFYAAQKIFQKNNRRSYTGARSSNMPKKNQDAVESSKQPAQLSKNGPNAKSAEEPTMKQGRTQALERQIKMWETEAYGVSLMIKTFYPEYKPVVLGWGIDPDSSHPSQNLVEAYMDVLHENGFPNVQYVSVASFPPIGIPYGKQMELLKNALSKIGDANLIIYKGAVLPETYLSSECRSMNVAFLQTSFPPNEKLWEKGVILGNITVRAGINPDSYPDNPNLALLKGFVVKINEDKIAPTR